MAETRVPDEQLVRSLVERALAAAEAGTSVQGSAAQAPALAPIPLPVPLPVPSGGPGSVATQNRSGSVVSRWTSRRRASTSRS